MSLGLENGTVRVVSYRPEWPGLFVAESERLLALASAVGLPLVLEHTGSTAVPGLAAKPILDMLGGFPEGATVARYVELFTGSGYIHRGAQDIPGREFFRRGDPRAYHLHLTTIGSRFWRDQLTFRDRLRADDTIRNAYAALKLALAARFPRDRESYIEGKTEFVNAVLAQATRRPTTDPNR